MAVTSRVEDGAAQGGFGPGTADSGSRQDYGRPARPADRNLTDDEILGLGVRTRTRTSEHRENRGNRQNEDALSNSVFFDQSSEQGREDSIEDHEDDDRALVNGEPKRFREAFDENPELRRAWQEAEAFRQSFATPEEARSAMELVNNINSMDALFFSHRPEDHSELARVLAKLNPRAFASFAEAMSKVAADAQQHQPGRTILDSDGTSPDGARLAIAQPAGSNTKNENGVDASQHEFFHGANAEAVKGVLAAIESQVDRLLPERVSIAARNRVVGEIYRELDASLQSNGQFSRQVRGALKSGAFDAGHRNAVVSLIVGRARQALPSVAKRVLGEWSSMILAAHQDRSARQRSGENRVDIAGSHGGASEGHRARSPRDIDYGRMSDSDILNL